MAVAGSVRRKLKVFGVKSSGAINGAPTVCPNCENKMFRKIIILGVILLYFFLPAFGLAQDIKEANVAGQFYPADKDFLSQLIDQFFSRANPEKVEGNIFCLISPHAGYEFSGQIAAFGYKLIKGLPYKTVIIIGPSHYYGFQGASVYPKGKFRTPLGDLDIDEDFAGKIIGKNELISFQEAAFKKEHSIEVQLPFLQKAVSDFKIVPIVIGNCDLKTLKDLADLIAGAVGARQDVLLVASTDLYHGYDWQEAENVDSMTLKSLENMRAEDIFNSLNTGAVQMCGGLPVVSALYVCRALGHGKFKLLKHTTSAQVSGNKTKGLWTVGYASCAIDNPISKEAIMLNDLQKKRLLEIARQTIMEYLTTRNPLAVKENDPVLNEICGAFVTLHESGELRGCIGNLVGQKPLYLTVRDMAIESATGDPRFPEVTKDEMKNIEIEISVLTPMKRIKDINEFKLGTHGVVVKRGWQSGVFLPQVATETGWTKEEFLSNLCAQKAGLKPDAWKDPDIEVLIFSAFVFSEKEAR